MPLMLRGRCLGFVEDDMRKVLERFDRAVGRGPSENNDQYADNAPLSEAFTLFQEETDEKKRADAFISFLNILAKRISEGGMVPVPFVDVNNVMFEGLDLEHVKAGDEIQLKEEVRLRMDTMTDGDGDELLPSWAGPLGTVHSGLKQTAEVI